MQFYHFPEIKYKKTHHTKLCNYGKIQAVAKVIKIHRFYISL